MCEMWKMCNFMFTFCAYLAEGFLVAGSGTGSGLWDKPRPSTCVAFASYFVCAMCVCVCVCTIFFGHTVEWIWQIVEWHKPKATRQVSEQRQQQHQQKYNQLFGTLLNIWVMCVCFLCVSAKKEIQQYDMYELMIINAYKDLWKVFILCCICGGLSSLIGVKLSVWNLLPVALLCMYICIYVCVCLCNWKRKCENMIQSHAQGMLFLCYNSIYGVEVFNRSNSIKMNSLWMMISMRFLEL